MRPLLATPGRSQLRALLVVPALAAVLALGVWIAGGVLTNSFVASIVLTTAWFALTGLACLVLAVRRRDLRYPVLGTYVVTAALVGGYLGWGTVHDRVARERVVTGAPASAVASAPGGTAASGRNVQLSSAAFRSGEHDTTGRAAVVQVAGGARVLTLTDLETSAGPDLRLRLVPGDSTDGGATGAIDLGALKGNRGSQQYELPPGAPTTGTVVIWCRAFTVDFGSAVLRAS